MVSVGGVVGLAIRTACVADSRASTGNSSRSTGTGTVGGRGARAASVVAAILPHEPSPRKAGCYDVATFCHAWAHVTIGLFIESYESHRTAKLTATATKVKVLV